VTAEVGGQTAHDRLGPNVAPAIAWLRQQTADVTVLLGGRNEGSTPQRIEQTINGEPLDSFDAAPGFFMRLFSIPAAAFGGVAGYVPLSVSVHGIQPITLEQFDAQPPGTPMFGYDAGWHEPEYNQAQGHAWRWMSEKATLWVRPIGRPVTLHLSGESPRRYFDAAPHVRVTIGDHEIAAFDLSSDFDQTMTLPPDALTSADGHVTIECSRFFVPSAGGAADRRHLALRVYRVSVE